MSDTIRVIDLSEWTGPVPVENTRHMKALGIEGVILQAWGSGHIPGRRNEYFHPSVDAFREAGITNIDPYIWPPSEWRQALDWIGDYKRFMSGAAYLDVEAGAGVDDNIILGVDGAGWEPRIYASPHSWNAIMLDTTRYSDLKLWLARYLLRFRRPDGYYRPGFDVAFPEAAFAPGVPRIGGWRTEDLVGWQTTGTVPDFCGESVDCSVFHRRAFQQEEDDMANTFDSIMLGFNGEPLLFQIMKADLSWGMPQPLTHRAYVLLSSLRLVNDPAMDALHFRAACLEAETHEHDDPTDDWQGALDSHEANPDAHHA